MHRLLAVQKYVFDMLGFAKIGPGRWDHLERRVRKVALGLRSEPRGEGTGGPKISNVAELHGHVAEPNLSRQNSTRMQISLATNTKVGID